MILNNPRNLEHNSCAAGVQTHFSFNKLILNILLYNNIKNTLDCVNVVFLSHTYIGPIFINVWLCYVNLSELDFLNF